MINLHPLVTHFPIALTFGLFIYELWCYFKKREVEPHLRTFLLLFILLGALTSVGTGLWYEENMPHPHEGAVNDVMEWHETFGYIALGGVIVLNILNRFFLQKRWGQILYRNLLVIAVVLVGLQGYLGGELGHRYGLSLPEGQHPSIRSREVNPRSLKSGGDQRSPPDNPHAFARASAQIK